ncbi:hypothetical protein [Streptomyces sp. NPDC090057]|uniref:hypothetical protein n=1 Tax=Streptomyces sp. NPDC090057 TaxID=3365935 RepID=UPI00382B21CC
MAGLLAAAILGCGLITSCGTSYKIGGDGNICDGSAKCDNTDQGPSVEQPDPAKRRPHSSGDPSESTPPDDDNAEALPPEDQETPSPTRHASPPVGKPLPVALSGSSVPDGVQLTPDSCVMGRCTFQSEANIPIGDSSFNTGWIVKCTIGCGSTEKADIDLQLSSQYRTLDATLGIDGQSTSLAGPVTIRIINKTNETLLKEYTFTSGKSVPLHRFNVAGVTILRFEFLGPLSTSMAAVGSPIAYP